MYEQKPIIYLEEINTSPKTIRLLNFYGINTVNDILVLDKEKWLTEHPDISKSCLLEIYTIINHLSDIFSMAEKIENRIEAIRRKSGINDIKSLEMPQLTRNLLYSYDIRTFDELLSEYRYTSSEIKKIKYLYSDIRKYAKIIIGDRYFYDLDNQIKKENPVLAKSIDMLEIGLDTKVALQKNGITTIKDLIMIDAAVNDSLPNVSRLMMSNIKRVIERITNDSSLFSLPEINFANFALIEHSLKTTVSDNVDKNDACKISEPVSTEAEQNISEPPKDELQKRTSSDDKHQTNERLKKLEMNDLEVVMEKSLQDGKSYFRDDDLAHKKVEDLSEELKDITIYQLNLNIRTIHALERQNIKTVPALLQAWLDDKDFMQYPGIGQLTQNDINLVIQELLVNGEEYLKTMNKKYGDDKEDNNVVNNEKLKVLGKKLGERPVRHLRLKTKTLNALENLDIRSISDLIQAWLENCDFTRYQGIGQQTMDDIKKAIQGLVNNGKEYLVAINEMQYQDTRYSCRKKGFDYSAIKVLQDRFGFSLSACREWFGISRQRTFQIYKDKKAGWYQQWTGQQFSAKDSAILNEMIYQKKLFYEEDNDLCYIMNDENGNYAVLFVYRDNIKCFFKEDLPKYLRTEITISHMDRWTQSELDGDSAGEIVYYLHKPYFRPYNSKKFQKNAMHRKFSKDEYAIYMSGLPALHDSIQKTDPEIIAFFQENLIEGKVYISSDPKNQWIKRLASQEGCSLKEFVEEYGYEYMDQGFAAFSDFSREQKYEEYRLLLKQYVVEDNIVYIPTSDPMYIRVNSYASNRNKTINQFIKDLGFVRTYERPKKKNDYLETDMQIRDCLDDHLEHNIFDKYPLLGSAIIEMNVFSEWIKETRQLLSEVLTQGSHYSLNPSQAMRIVLTVINIAKNWDSDVTKSFWEYLFLQIGFRDQDKLREFIQSILESTLTQNDRLFIESSNQKEFRSTILVHAISPKKIWFSVFDFLYKFYSENLNGRFQLNDPMLNSMIEILQKKLESLSDNDVLELDVREKKYYFNAEIRYLIRYRPKFMRDQFEKLLSNIDRLMKGNELIVLTYEDKLIQEWYRERILKAGLRKTLQPQQKNFALGSSHRAKRMQTRIFPKFILKDDRAVYLEIQDIHIDKEIASNPVVYLFYGEECVYEKTFDLAGDEFGRTIIGTSIKLPDIAEHAKQLKISLKIKMGGEEIYHSDNKLYRERFIFSGPNEIQKSNIEKGHYLFLLPESVHFDVHNGDSEYLSDEDITPRGWIPYLVDVDRNTEIRIDDHLINVRTKRSTRAIKVIPPESKENLPLVEIDLEEYQFIPKNSICWVQVDTIECVEDINFRLNNIEIKTGFKIRPTDNGKIWLGVQLDTALEKRYCWIQILDKKSNKIIFEQRYLLYENASSYFNRAVYYTSDDYKDAVYKIIIDDFEEYVSFTEDDDEIRIPFIKGDLHIDIPKISIHESTGEWLNRLENGYYIDQISQESQLSVRTTSEHLNIRFFIDEDEVDYDGKGTLLIGNILHSIPKIEKKVPVELRMVVNGYEYILADIYYQEQFLIDPVFWFEDGKIYWDHHNAFIGKQDRSFTFSLMKDSDILFSKALSINETCMECPVDLLNDQYSYQLSIQSGGRFKKKISVIASGECIIGDINAFRFKGKLIQIDSLISDDEAEQGYLNITPCYIEAIRYQGIQETSEGRCPVYQGILFRISKKDGSKKYFSDSKENNTRISYQKVNPVRIIYINDSVLSITDQEEDGLYYYQYRDKYTSVSMCSLTDREPDKYSKYEYNIADLYSYTTIGEDEMNFNEKK